MDDAVPMIRRCIERVELQRNTAGIDDVVQHFASFVDITKHMKEEEHLRYLLDELNHRTQNTVATVQAIAVQTLRGAADTRPVATFH